jgi:hypothetical protein
MQIVKLAAVAATLALGAAAHAGTVTRDAAPFAVGADVTTAFSGVTLTRQKYTAGGALLVSPVIVENCTTFGICSLTGPLKAFGGTAYNLAHFRDCYNAALSGIVSSQCAIPHNVLSAEFNSPTDFVEFSATWGFDAPVMIAYDAAGNQLAQCFSGTCIGSINIPVENHLGTIRITSSMPNIKRVIVGAFSGSSQLTSIQYNMPNRWCAAQKH